MVSDKVHLEINYGGKFYLSQKKELFYRLGNIHSVRNFFEDEISLVVLKQIVESEIDGIKFRELWYAIPGKKLEDGLVRIESDRVALEMLGHKRLTSNELDIYLIQLGETGPSELRGLYPLEIIPNFPAENQHENQQNIEESDENEPQVNTTDHEEPQVNFSDHEEPEECQEIQSEVPSEFSIEVDNLVEEELAYISDKDADSDASYATCEINLDDDAEISGSDDSDGKVIKARFPRFNPAVDYKKEVELVMGMVFTNASVFRAALCEYAVQSGANYYFSHNDAARVDAFCINRCECPLVRGRKKCACNDRKCGWRVSAKRICEDGTFQIKIIEQQHNCTWQEKNSKVTSKWLAIKYIDMYKNDPDWKITAFMEDVRTKYGVQITYNMAWKAKHRAIIMTRGNSGQEYGKVHDYAATVRHFNPGSSTYIKVDITNPEKPLFQRMYISLKACIRGFKEGCRPIIGLDGCHLRGAYPGQVLTAVGNDGNNNIYPIAYAVVEAERRDSWAWFLQNLMEDVADVHPTFISDRQKGLVEALNVCVNVAVFMYVDMLMYVI